jgi:prepilin-type N-terminal cleavage/methylation domain-containing protein
MVHPSSKRRRGLTLMEVIIAMVIFLMSAVAIGNLLSIGSQRAWEAQLQSQALVRCQSKMSEVIAGSVPITDGSDNQAFDDDNDWSWSMTSTQQDAMNLYLVTITVTRNGDNDVNAQVSLSQMIVDPIVRAGANGGVGAMGGTANGAAGGTGAMGGNGQ